MPAGLIPPANPLRITRQVAPNNGGDMNLKTIAMLMTAIAGLVSAIARLIAAARCTP